MNYCTIQGELNDDTLRDFINKANDFNQDEELTIYINSCGGTCGISGALVYFIPNSIKDEAAKMLSEFISKKLEEYKKEFAKL